MSWGGGPIGTMQQTIPGTYIDINVSSSELPKATRGYLAVATDLAWGKDGEVIEVTVEDYQRYSKEIFGYNFGEPEVRYIDEMFKGGATTLYIYRTNSGQVSKSSIGKAQCSGALGNTIKVVVEENPDYVDPEED